MVSRMSSRKNFLKKCKNKKVDLFGNPVQCFYQGESTAFRKSGWGLKLHYGKKGSALSTLRYRGSLLNLYVYPAEALILRPNSSHRRFCGVWKLYRFLYCLIEAELDKNLRFISAQSRLPSSYSTGLSKHLSDKLRECLFASFDIQLLDAFHN